MTRFVSPLIAGEIRKFAKVLLPLFLLLGVYSTPGLTAPPKEIVAAVSADFPPHLFVDRKTHKPAGFGVDVMDAIAERLGLTVRYQVFDTWEEINQAARKGLIDVVPDEGIIEERTSYLRFTDPIETFFIYAFVRGDTKSFTSLDDLSGMHIGVVPSNKAQFLLQDRKDIDLAMFENFEALFLAVISGTVDAIVAPEPPILSIAHRSGLEERIKRIGQPLVEIKRAMAVPHGKEELYNLLAGEVDNFVGSPQYFDIYRKWYGKQAASFNLKRLMFTAAAAIAGVAILLLLWRHFSILRLNRQLKRSQSQLQESEGRFRQLAENVPEVFWVSSTDWQEIFYISPAYEAVFGRSCDSLYAEPMSWLECIDPSDRDKVAAAIPKGIPEIDEQVIFPAYKINRPDGSQRLIRARAFPVRDERGEIYRVAGIAEDITVLRQGEEALRESEAFTRVILDNLPVGIAVNSIEPPVTFEYMNDNFPKFYRTTREELAEPDSFWNAVYKDPAFREEIKKRVLDDCVSGDPQRMRWEQVPVTRKGEPTSYITAQNIPVPGRHLMISMVWDVTEGKRAEKAREKLQQQFIQAQKMESVGRLAGGVAHDFNNMLSVILGQTELVMREIDPSSPLLADLQQIMLAATRSADLTRQLLAFARKQTVAPQVLDLNEAVEGMLKMLRRLIGEDIDLAWNPGRKLWSVKVDPAQLDQILANLCVNARDAIADVGKITIETGNIVCDEAYCADHSGLIPGDFVFLALSDNGCGMDREILNKIFEPFFTTKGVGQGTGLGLATVYGIVKQNEGLINVYSEPGQGTTFKIYLPRHRGKDEPAEQEGEKETITGGLETVLLVEDEPVLLKMVERMLEGQGYRILATSEPAEAIRLAEEYSGQIDLLITDIVMPGMNGRDLATKLLSLLPDLKCLFMSGYTANAIAHHGVLDEGVHFIQKPFSAKDLAAKVRETLG